VDLDMKNIMLVILMLFCMPMLAYSEAQTIICNYSSYSDDNGTYKLKEKLVLTFIVDKIKNVAHIRGIEGTDRVAMIPSAVGRGISFIEITAAGNVMTTTIDSIGESVHSRNIIINGKIAPTHCYGECEIK